MYFLLCIQWGISSTQMPIYIHELGGSPFEVGLVYTVFAGIMVLASPLWGSFSDFLGKKKIFLVLGMLGLTPIFAIIAYQKEAFPIILLRGSTAIFVGAIQSITWALVSDISSPKVIGRNLGIFNTVQISGFAIGPVIGGIIVDIYSFSALWFFVSGICFLGGLIFLFLGSDSKKIKREKSKGLFFKGLTKSDSISKIIMMCVSYPLFLLGHTLLGPNLNIYLFKDLNFSQTMVGITNFIGTGISAIIQPFTGVYSDKYGRKKFFILTAILLILGNILLIQSRTPLFVTLSLILIRYMNSFQLLSSAYVNDIIPTEEKSGALGLLNATGSLAWSLGAAIGGLIITASNIPTVIFIANLFPVFGIIIIMLSLKE